MSSNIPSTAKPTTHLLSGMERSHKPQPKYCKSSRVTKIAIAALGVIGTSITMHFTLLEHEREVKNNIKHDSIDLLFAIECVALVGQGMFAIYQGIRMIGDCMKAKRTNHYVNDLEMSIEKK